MTHKFKDRLFEVRLDSGHKPFRKVYKAGNEVIIIYDGKCTPKSMLRQYEDKMLPLEWIYCNEYRLYGDSMPAWINTYGLPEIIETGIHRGNPYIIEEYIDGVKIKDVVDPTVSFDLRWAEYYSMCDFVSACSVCFLLLGNGDYSTILTPDNILFTLFTGLDCPDDPDDDSSGVSLKLVGIDSILFPEYKDDGLRKYYNSVYLPQWKDCCANDTILYSTILTMLNSFGNTPVSDVPSAAKLIYNLPLSPFQAVSLTRSLMSPLLRPRSLRYIFENDEVGQDLSHNIVTEQYRPLKEHMADAVSVRIEGLVPRESFFWLLRLQFYEFFFEEVFSGELNEILIKMFCKDLEIHIAEFSRHTMSHLFKREIFMMTLALAALDAKYRMAEDFDRLNPEACDMEVQRLLVVASTLGLEDDTMAMARVLLAVIMLYAAGMNNDPESIMKTLRYVPAITDLIEGIPEHWRERNELEYILADFLESACIDIQAMWEGYSTN